MVNAMIVKYPDRPASFGAAGISFLHYCQGKGNAEPTEQPADGAPALHALFGIGRVAATAFCLLLSALVFCQSAFARADTKSMGIDPYCNAAVDEGDTRSLRYSPIERIDVTISNSRKWAKNNFKILRTRSVTILPKQKKKFYGTIVAHYANGLVCSFDAKLRQSGDLKDHVQFRAGKIINSLDVKLSRGHINGIVRFKLLIPRTRRGKNEVILANLLTVAGFLAPRTALVKVNFMGQPTEMIFQEKPRKELLEHNLMREGPLLEGDERTMFPTTEAKALGLSEEQAADLRLVFSRLTNNKWAAKGPNSLEISREAVGRLNYIYLKHRYLRFIKNVPQLNLYLDNNLLANGNPSQLQYLNEYDALLRAANAGHALYPHNRKFYFDPMYGYFHPIYYDGDVLFGKYKVRYKRKPQRFAIEGAPGAIKIIESLDAQAFADRLGKVGVPMTKAQVESIFRTLKENLVLLSKMKAPDFSSVVPPPQEDYLKEIRKRRNEDIWTIRLSSRNLAGTSDVWRATACDWHQESCRSIKLNRKKSSKLLAGKFKYRKKPTVFYDAGNRDSEPDINSDKHTRLSPAIASDIEVITSPGMTVSEDIPARTITFQQRTTSDWALLRKGSLRDVTIVFRGALKGEPKKGAAPAQAQRFNTRLLTGCLSLLDMAVKKLRVVVDQGGCEDGVNMVRVKGQIDSIKVHNTVSDAIDLDFSEITFDEINVQNAENDCIDFSTGKYVIKSIRAKNCADKGISLGEGSHLHVGRALIEKATIGAGIKDSSVFSAERFEVQDTKTCVAVYRKKQEFSGAIAKIAASNCPSSAIRADPGSAVVAGRRL